MRIEGEYTFEAPRQDVWVVLHNPDALSRALPGVEQFREVGPNEYEATVTAGVAAVRGTYHGRVKMADLQPPERYTLNAQGQGSAGTFDATAQITLLGQNGRTQLRYEADAQVGGPVAGVGQRMLGGVAKLMAGQFFKAMEEQLHGPGGTAVGAMAGTPPVASTRASKGATTGLGAALGLAGPAGPIAAASAAGLVLGLLLGRRPAPLLSRSSFDNADLAAALRDVADAIRTQRRR